MGNELKNEPLGAKWGLVICLNLEKLSEPEYCWVIATNQSCPIFLPEDSRAHVQQDLVRVKEMLRCSPFSAWLAGTWDHSFLSRTVRTALQLQPDVCSDHPKIRKLQRLWQFELWSYTASLFLHRTPRRAGCDSKTCNTFPGFSCVDNPRIWEEERRWHGDIWMWEPDMS